MESQWKTKFSYVFFTQFSYWYRSFANLTYRMTELFNGWMENCCDTCLVLGGLTRSADATKICRF